MSIDFCTNDSSTPSKEKQINFAALHKYCRKDVECMFEML